ncbi:MAG: glycogen debranching enzyme N-terminal domain-containing protein [Pyrinomonadaceae bacterium]|nr:glycogen debranching enzyme N-terminal domain-containing protein [Pyrinomonadaceae bacterium]
MIILKKDICSDFERASSREWLETNGIGGYASSTVSGANTRRYHGLLVAATQPPLGRVVMLSKFEETAIINGERFEISCNQYPGKVHPDGCKYLVELRLDPFPIWTYEVNGSVIEKSVFMVNGENTTVCQWKVTGEPEISVSKIEIELRPLLAFRDHHHLRSEHGGFDKSFQIGDGAVSVRPVENMPSINIAHNAFEVEEQGYWYKDLEYEIERERGFDFHEDLFQPFSLKFDLTEPAVVIASTEQRVAADADILRRSEMKRRAAIIAGSGAKDSLSRQLVLAADQFIVDRGAGKTVIAGYHWFSDWGRDTMIALPGLTFSTGRPAIAKSILTEFSNHISEGMVPNRFPDVGETPDYNTVDATLWFFEAIRAYTENTGDFEFVRVKLYDKLAAIIDWHVRGTRYGIHVDTDGLLYAGEPGTQLTWMDAKIGDLVITPRTGKAVEIQALWYNALCIMSDLAVRFGDTAQQARYSEMDEVARESFNGQFWNDDAQCLYDVIDGVERDPSVRPNQIFAVSLRHSMVDPERARKIVDKVEAELLTPVGLRSLSPLDSRYVPVYVGSPIERDSAYHQGTVWGWLIGPFVDAFRKVHSKDPIADARISQILEGFDAHISGTMVGQISEIFDGEHPHKARGCAAQAWSVAELLRVNFVAR